MSFSRAAIFLLILIGFRPAGILLGLGIGTSSGLGAHLMIAVLQSLSAGIFIHLTFFSLLPGEFGRPGVNFTNNLPAADLFSFSLNTLWLCNLLAKRIRRKSCLESVAEIDSRREFLPLRNRGNS
jgi:hypothetical protein